MTPEQWKKLDDLFHEALELHEESRAAFLLRACGGDERLREEAVRLIAAHEREDSFIDSPIFEPTVESTDDDRHESPVGRRIGPYQVVSQLGRGGMGEVYLAEDSRLGRKVAIKLLPAKFTADAGRVRRFEQEARASSRLNHPNIITVHDIGEIEGKHYLVEEFIDGQTLRQPLNDAPQQRLEIERALDITAQMARALAAAHEAGIVHRDIKPENVMVRPDGLVKVLDFGLAKLSERPAASQEIDSQAKTTERQSTESGVIMGTVSYMSPEQARGLKMDHRTDIFSLGVMVYELVAGQRPFEGATASDVLAAILQSEPKPVSLLRSGLPPEWELMIDRMLAKDREARYGSAAELRSMLQRLQRKLEAETNEIFSTGETSAAKLAAPALAAFVGREAEMQRLEQLLQGAIVGAGRLVFITGEPGIGKTSLGDKFLCDAQRRHPSLICGRGRCVEQYGTGEAYLPFLDALGALLAGPQRERITGLLRTHAPTWCLQFPAVFSRDTLEFLRRDTIGATKERMLREMGEALGALAAQSPVALLLEDLHWADTSSADLLRHLSQRIEGQQLLLIATFRPGDLEISNHPLKSYKLEMQAHHQCEEIALGTLSQENLASYIDARFAPNDFAHALAPLLERKTEGHPLFATGLVQLLADRGDIARANGQWTLTRPLAEMDLEAPESVRSLIRKKIETLDEEDRRLLQYASVEGEEFLSIVLAGLLGIDEIALEERCDDLHRVHRLIEPRGEEELPDGTLTIRYRFVHALYQNVLYAELVSKRRAQLHRQAGEQLLKHYGDQSSRIAAQLAVHFERSRDFERAVAYLLEAGDNAAGVYANAEAERHYSYALGLVEKLPREEQSEKRLTICQKRGAVNHALGRFDQAIADFTSVLDEARRVAAPAREGSALVALCHTLFFAHRLDEMAARAGEALRVAESSGDERLRAETLAFIGRRHGSLGNLVEAEQLLGESIRIARRLDYKPALIAGLGWRGQLHFFQSEYERAEEMLSEALHLSSELRDGFNVLFCLYFLGLTRGELGRISEALATLNEAMEMARRNGDRNLSLKIPNSIGWIYRELGDLDQALEHDREGVEVARRHQLLEAEINSVINLGYDYTERGEGEKAPPAFREVEAMLERDDWFRWRFNLRLQSAKCEYLLSHGDPAEAEACARRLFELATHYEARKYVAVARRLLAEAVAARGDLTVAETELEAALDLLRKYPSPPTAWRIHAALGRLRAQMGQTQAAREAFAEAAAVIRMMADNVSDERLRGVFLNSVPVREVIDGAQVADH
jgi:serine/threonine protein kinase/tetratricopeptide (TPR) repeat protein